MASSIQIVSSIQQNNSQIQTITKCPKGIMILLFWQEYARNNQLQSEAIFYSGKTVKLNNINNIFQQGYNPSQMDGNCLFLLFLQTFRSLNNLSKQLHYSFQMIKNVKKMKQAPCLIIRTDIEEFQSACFRFQTEPISKIRKLLKKLLRQGYAKKIVQIVHIMIVICRNPQKLVKVLKIVDKIINFKEYRTQMQRWLSSNYFDIFSRLKQLNKQKQLQQVMIIRKFWLGRIDFEVYQLMKTHMLQSYKINIDCVRQDIIPFIKRYYLEILKLDIKTIEYHLPQIASKIDYTHVIYQFCTFYPYKKTYRVGVSYCNKKNKVIRNKLIFGAYQTMAKNQIQSEEIAKIQAKVLDIPPHRRKKFERDIMIPKATKKFIAQQICQSGPKVTPKVVVMPQPQKEEPPSTIKKPQSLYKILSEQYKPNSDYCILFTFIIEFYLVVCIYYSMSYYPIYPLHSSYYYHLPTSHFHSQLANIHQSSLIREQAEIDYLSRANAHLASIQQAKLYERQAYEKEIRIARLMAEDREKAEMQRALIENKLYQRELSYQQSLRRDALQKELALARSMRQYQTQRSAFDPLNLVKITKTTDQAKNISVNGNIDKSEGEVHNIKPKTFHYSSSNKEADKSLIIKRSQLSSTAKDYLYKDQEEDVLLKSSTKRRSSILKDSTHKKGKGNKVRKVQFDSLMSSSKRKSRRQSQRSSKKPLKGKELLSQVSKRIQNRLKVSSVVYKDSQFRNIKYQIDHLFNTFDTQSKLRKQLKGKINSNDEIIQKYNLVVNSK